MSAQKQKEEMSRKAEEEKRKEDEANALKQQKATLSVLRTLQKMSNATPENFDDVNTEFENMLTTDLPNTGPQQERGSQTPTPSGGQSGTPPYRGPFLGGQL